MLYILLILPSIYYIPTIIYQAASELIHTVKSSYVAILRLLAIKTARAYIRSHSDSVRG